MRQAAGALTSYSFLFTERYAVQKDDYGDPHNHVNVQGRTVYGPAKSN